MTPEEMNEAIASHLGLDVCREPNPAGDRWKTAYFTPEAASIRRKSWPSSAFVQTIPNYHGDLNSMREARQFLNDSQKWDYMKYLRAASFEAGDGYWCLVDAEASQHAEAFVCTIGKWVESKQEAAA